MFSSLHTHTNKQRNPHRHKQQRGRQCYDEKKIVERRRESGRKKREERKGCNKCASCTISRDERNEKMREFVIFFWLCSTAEHIKLGSNPSSQYLLHLVCWYILYIFVYITHTNIINRWMDYMELRASHYSQTKGFNLGWFGLLSPVEKGKKKWINVRIMDFDISYWRQAPIK